jgi:hypothetical protein
VSRGLILETRIEVIVATFAVKVIIHFALSMCTIEARKQRAARAKEEKKSLLLLAHTLFLALIYMYLLVKQADKHILKYIYLIVFVITRIIIYIYDARMVLCR